MIHTVNKKPWGFLAVGGLLGLSLFLSGVGISMALVRYSHARETLDLQTRVFFLSTRLDQLTREQEMPSIVLSRYRNSICYIVGIYDVGFRHQKPIKRTRVSGTGFLVEGGLVATNRHVAEPWYKDQESDALIASGARPRLETLVAYFPGSPSPVNLNSAAVSADRDLVILRMGKGPSLNVQPVPLAAHKPNPGELVVVVGYPLGVQGMVAKAPASVYARLAQHSHIRDDQDTANELATLSLVRPLPTWGHVGDVVGETLIYDAPTAHGASGGPVFNSRAEVVGVNSAFIDGFSGGTLGIVSEALKPLIQEAQGNTPKQSKKRAYATK